MTGSQPFGDRLAVAVQSKRSVVCVGLDPRWGQLPEALRSQFDDSAEGQAAAFQKFCEEIIEVISPMVGVIKPQAAFFEQLGPAGMIALAEVIRCGHEHGLVVILDGKRGDIGSTATAYADAYLGAGDRSPWGADALTVNPYLGKDAIDPFVTTCDDRDAGIFVLVKTSNPGGGLLQDRVTDEQTVYQATADLVRQENESRIGETGYGPIGAVVGATYPDQLAELRDRMPNTWILIPGFGAQGGGKDDVAPGFDQKGLGAIVNSSRHIIFAHGRSEFEAIAREGWQKAVNAATAEMNDQLSHLLA